MKDRADLGQLEFNALLNQLSADRQEAGTRYERIRRGLLIYFSNKGCADPAELTDTTLDRVAARLDAFDGEKSRIESFIYGFARNIVMESKRSANRHLPLNGNEAFEDSSNHDETFDMSCLKTCLSKLDAGDREMILKYHTVTDGKKKADARQKMIDELNVTPAAFYTKISRIKVRLRKCLEECKQTFV